MSRHQDTETDVAGDVRYRPPKTPMRWTNDINLGQLIQGGAVIVAVVGSHYAQSTKIEKAEMRIGAQQEMIARIERVTDSLANSQQSIAVTLAALSTKVEDGRRRTP